MTTDPENIKNLVLGDKEAYRQIFYEYYPKVKGFIYSLIKSDLYAEDLAQDIFTKIWINRESLSVVESLNSYIFQMTRNRVINHIKSNTIRSLYKANININDSENSLEEEFYAKETQLLIDLVVQKMPPQRKKIFELSRYKGVSNDDIATSLCIAKKTVENHLNAALKEIRKALV